VIPRTFRGWSLLALAVAVAPALPAEAQECEQGRISDIFVNNQSVFDTSTLNESDSWLWLYDFANWLHMQTREDFLEAELLFEVGDCLKEQLLEESERLLRNHKFIAVAEVFPVRQPDGTIHVVVNTRDEWTLQFSLRTRIADGLELNGLDLTEENLFGRGVSLTGFFRQKREDRRVGLALSTVRFLGTRWDTSLRGGETRVGPFVGQSFTYPFVGEVGHIAARQSYTRREDLFAYSIEDNPEYTHLTRTFIDERAEITVAGRIGRAGSLTILGGGISYDELRFNELDRGTEAIVDKDFGNPVPAPEELGALVAPQLREISVGRLNFILGQRNLTFVPRRGLDALQGVQDIAEGFEAGVIVSRSLGFLTPDNVSTTNDIFTRVRLFGGLAPGRWVFNGTVSFEVRQVLSARQGEEGWRDQIGEVDLYAYWQPMALSGHTFFARVSGAGGWNVDLPFQLTLGGEAGVRGYNQDRFPGGRRLVASIEDRIYLGSPGNQALDLGATIFADIGRMWNGDVPFGRDSDWLASVGAGLRVGFPAGTRGVVRIDLAVPVNGEGAFDSVAFRITASELLGLFRGFEDRQLARSRRSTSGEGILPNPAVGR
jgi:Omp85 superfamily domain